MPDDPGHGERRSRSSPETLRLRAICPQITVSDLQASLTWYCDVVGFHLAETWERDGSVVGVSLAAGSERLVLLQADGDGALPGGRIHLELRTVQDVDALASGVRSRGGTFSDGPAPRATGERSFTLTDPDGTVLTITSER